MGAEIVNIEKFSSEQKEPDLKAPFFFSIVGKQYYLCVFLRYRKEQAYD